MGKKLLYLTAVIFFPGFVNQLAPPLLQVHIASALLMEQIIIKGSCLSLYMFIIIISSYNLALSRVMKNILIIKYHGRQLIILISVYLKNIICLL
jgi:hypothetical protein